VVGVAVALGALTFIRPWEKRADVSESNIELWFADSVDRVRGHVWPRYNGVPSEVTSVESLSRVTIHFANGYDLTSRAKLLVMTQAAGNVRHVAINVSMETRPPQDAFADAIAFMSRVGLTLEPNSRTNLERWRHEVPSSADRGPFVLRCKPIANIAVPEVIVRFHDESRRWFVVLEVGSA
jgi:hypothetical protein